jgi:hypothetical protein
LFRPDQLPAEAVPKPGNRTLPAIPGRVPRFGRRTVYREVTVLIENVRHHVKEEEQDWFPQVRKAMGNKALRRLGEELAAAKSRAPSDPLKIISATA